jgi:VIT1/CCC1 family predicted Fe2+/Mn2+ transporter
MGISGSDTGQRMRNSGNAMLRVVFGGALAMLVTYRIGQLVGTTI